MRKTYLLLITLFVSMMAMAESLTPDEARQKITKFMTQRRAKAVLQDLRLVATSHYQERADVLAPSFYVFNVGVDQGYIIAGADDRMPAVLGYSDSGSFDPQRIPANMEAWLKGYDDQMEYLSQHPEAAAPKKTVSGGSISPLLTSKWNQGDPYNSLCPMDGDKRSVTGCVATAMAQVMYFWKFPSQTTTEIPAYTTNSKKLAVGAIPAGTAIDWSNMVNQYKGSETDAQKQAVASLMLMCGAAMEMDYRSSTSSAYTQEVADKLKTYFDYDAATTHENRNGYRLAAWNQKVYDELDAGRPVIYHGQSSGGGHAFIIDGYSSNDYFHVNWGWGGGTDDYFLLSILDSKDNSGIGASNSSDGYSMDQGAVFGAQPNTGVTPTVTPILTTNNVALPSGAEFTRTDISEQFTISIGFAIYNNMSDTYTFDWGVGLYDTNDQLVSTSKAYYSTLKPGYGFWDPTSNPFTVSLGAGTTNATYVFKPISRERGTETWYADKGSDIWNVKMVIDGNTLTLIAPTFGLTGSLEAATGKREVGTPLAVTATITNNGTLYKDQIFLLVNGKMVSGRHYDLDAGKTETLGFTFIPKTAGENTITLCTRSWNSSTKQYDYTPFITGSVTVDTAPNATLTMTPTTKNAVKEGDIWIVKQSKAVVSIDVTNTGATDYDNDVIVKLYKLASGNKGYSAGTFKKGIQLAAGASTTVEVETNELEDGAKYFYYVYYMSAGEEVKGYKSSPQFTVQIEGEDPDPDPEVVKFTVQSIDVQGTMKTNEEVSMTINVKNEGNVQTGKLYYFINDVKQGEIAVDITPGDTKAYNVKYVPTAAGEYTVKVTTDEAGQVLAGEAAVATKGFTVEPKEETGYYLVCDLNGWSTTDKSLAFTKLSDGKTWEITFPGNDSGIYLKVAPGSAYDDPATFWNNLLCTETDGCTDLQGTMIKGNAGAWLLPASLNAESYTMRIVPSEMTYEITYQEKEKPFEPEPPYYYIGTATDWMYDATKIFTDNSDGTYSITIPAVYSGEGYSWFKIAPANAIANDGTVTWAHLYSTDTEGSTLLSGTMKIGDGEAWVRQQTDGAESYTITITPATNAIVIQPNIPGVVKFTVQSIDVPDSVKTNEEVDMTINVKNEGNVQTGKLYYFINDVKQGEIAVDITPGDTKAYNVKYVPTAAGEYTVKVTTDEAGQVLAGEAAAATKGFTVYEIPSAIRALWAGENGTAQIFSLNGHKQAEAQEADLMRVMSTLPKGVYIIRVGRNSKTIHN